MVVVKALISLKGMMTNDRRASLGSKVGQNDILRWGIQQRVQITSDLHPLFFSGEIVRVFEGGHRWLLEAGGYLVAEDTDSVCQRKKYSLFNYCTFIQRKTYRL